MPISTTWFDPEKTILLTTYTDPYSWEEFDAATGKVTQMAAEIAPNTVHLVVDMTNGSMPDSSVLGHLKPVEFPENVGVNIMINPPGFLRTVITIALNTFGRHMKDRNYFVHSMEAALEIIRKYDEESSYGKHKIS
jgi:hypothetical protein